MKVLFENGYLLDNVNLAFVPKLPNLITPNCMLYKSVLSVCDYIGLVRLAQIECQALSFFSSL